MSITPEPAEYDLVMPFIVCKIQGGPHDDDAFVAGWRLGQLDRDLETANRIGADQLHVTARPADTPQIDLVAMRHGYTWTSPPGSWSDPSGEWVHVLFDRVTPADSGEEAT